MAKKKSLKTNRKHQLKYAAPTGAVAPVTRPVKSATVAPSVVTTHRDFSYVTADLARIVYLGGGLILLLVVLWYLFGHTGLGPAAYNLIKL